MPLIITNEVELAAALERAEELAGCTNDSEEERELAKIETAVVDYLRAVKEAVALTKAPQNDNDPSTP